jgi:hypothetical protein
MVTVPHAIQARVYIEYNNELDALMPSFVSMGGAKGWAGWTTAHPEILKNALVSTVAHCSTTIVAHPEFSLSCGPSWPTTVAPPMSVSTYYSFPSVVSL